MSMQWCDDFHTYGSVTAYMLNGLYAETTNAVLALDPDPLAPVDYVLNQQGGGGGGYTRKVLSAAQTTVGMGVRVWPAALPSAGEVPIFSFNDSANGTNVLITYTTTGQLKAYRGESVTLLGSSTGPVIVANAYTHIEAKVFFSETVGTVEVRVNGVAKITLTNQDTVQNAIVSCSQVSLRNGPLQPSLYYKDFFVWDGSGTRNTNFLGMVSVYAITEASDVSLNWATSSGATGYNLINEAPPVDTGYISAGTGPIPAASVMSLTDLPVDVTSVKALMTIARARKTDGGDGSLQVALKSGASTDLGADNPLTTAFTYYYDFSEEDPATAAPWLRTAVNAANIQFNRTL
jgi:hypothetical protein